MEQIAFGVPPIIHSYALSIHKVKVKTFLNMDSNNYGGLIFIGIIILTIGSCHYDSKIKSLEHKVSILQSMTDDQSAQIADLQDQVGNIDDGDTE